MPRADGAARSCRALEGEELPLDYLVHIAIKWMVICHETVLLQARHGTEGRDLSIPKQYKRMRARGCRTIEIFFFVKRGRVVEASRNSLGKSAPTLFDM